MTRLVDQASGTTVLLPLDVVMPLGPLAGAEDLRPLVEMAGDVGIDGVILRWGEARRLGGGLAPGVALIVRLSGSTSIDGRERPAAVSNGLESSLAIGADAVCVDLELGGAVEDDSLRAMAGVVEAADRWGVPVMREVHVSAELGAEAVAWGVRTAQELGADLVKMQHPGSREAVANVVRQVEVPVVVAGGAVTDPSTLLGDLGEAMAGGARGVAVARNVICAPSPVRMQQAVIEVVRGLRSPEAAYAALLTRDGDNAGTG